MSEQIEKFDPSTLMQGVKDRIKATFVSLIPDAQWEIMVQKEIDAFFNETQKIIFSERKKDVEGRYHTENYATVEIQMTPFRQMVWELCAEKTIVLLKEKITNEYFNNLWEPTPEQLNENLKKIIVEAAPLATLKFFESMMFKMTTSLQNAIREHRI